jgi:hypothetical protein
MRQVAKMEHHIAAVANYVQGWQTLIAAIVALIAARRAYAAAMAKVEFDRELARNEIVSKKIGLLLRLRLAVVKLVFELSQFVDALEKAKEVEPSIGGGSVSVAAANLKLTNAPEFEEIWSKLDLVPAEAIDGLILIRESIPDFIDRANKFPPDKVWYLNKFNLGDGSLRGYIPDCRYLRGRAHGLLVILATYIERLRLIKPIA